MQLEDIMKIKNVIPQILNKLEYLRAKVANLEDENKEMFNRLEEHKCTCDEINDNRAQFERNTKADTIEEQNKDEEFTEVSRRKREKRLPPQLVSPGQGEIADPNKSQRISYAETVVPKRIKKPMQNIPVEILEQVDESDDMEDDNDNDNEKWMDDFTKEELEELKESVEESAIKLGVRPITLKMVKNETEKLIKSGLNDKNLTHQEIMEIATKNCVLKYLRDHLKMDEFTRSKLEITNIYPSKN